MSPVCPSVFLVVLTRWLFDANCCTLSGFYHKFFIRKRKDNFFMIQCNNVSDKLLVPFLPIMLSDGTISGNSKREHNHGTKENAEQFTPAGNMFVFTS